ncbi:MAG TPA: PilN domain-containing protein [Pseudolabrys sp.]|jgi:general secretion pathway protein L|nr:PilN domain-containing protein [Pseudolabrys sp.]
MTFLRQIGEAYAGWMDGVAAAATALLGRLTAPPKVRLIEQAAGVFALQPARGGAQAMPLTIANGIAACSPEAAAKVSGSRVELALRPDRFFFRPLEAPKRAAEFLDGVVRAQIDRITPWSVNEAAFGWSAPVEIANERIAVTVAAAPRAQLVPLTQALDALGAKSVAVSTALPDQTPITVFDESAADAAEARSVRRKLSAALLALALLAGSALAADIVVGNRLRDRQNDIAQRIAERRGLLRAGADAAANSALAQLERRKNASPASVIVLEALSNALPDNTYVTELRVEGTKVQVVGFTSDAPSLIRLIERSPHFSRATFFAPTTRAPSDPGDRFHIEAQIKPVFSPPS